MDGPLDVTLFLYLCMFYVIYLFIVTCQQLLLFIIY